MATPSVDVSPPDEADTGRLESASRLRVVLIILAIVAATEVGTFYFTFVSMATRYIGADFPGESAGQLTWMSTLYAIVGGVAVPVVGKLSDRIGKKKIVLACLAVSLIGSLVVALTSTWPLMLLGRGLQAIAFPALFVSYGLIRDLVPRRNISMAIALAGGGTGVGAVLGPVAGGVLTDHYSWRSLFWFCVVWTVVTIIPLAIFVPETKLRVKNRIDWVGAVLLGTGIGGVLIYLSEGGVWGWSHLSALAWLIGGIVLLVVFYCWELVSRDPIMDPKLLRTPRFVSVLAAAFLSVGIMQGVGYLMSYLAETPGGVAGEAIKQQVVAGAAQQAAAQASQQTHMNIPPSMVAHYFSVEGTLPGLNLTLLQFTLRALLAMTIVYVIVSPLCGWLSTRYGLRRPYLISPAMFIVSSVLFAFFHEKPWQLALIAMIAGIGAGAFLGTLPNMVVESVPQEQQGISAGMYGAFNSFGTAAAAAATAAIFSAHPLILHINAPGHVEARRLDTGPLAQLPSEAAYVDSFYMFAIAGAVALILAVVTMRHFDKPTTGGFEG
ncbi:MFS transporter [Nocardia jiangxiensis]|uniref:MFS transporter n=1 Tax=Nocardia jiangxiensis TaxID=282685 RepID=UPI00030B516A|nr:MFS transporter [Nocardia jiangxiensis]